MRNFAKQVPRTIIGSIYSKSNVNESLTDPIQPSQLEKEVMEMRNSITETPGNRSRNNFQPVKSLQAFKKMQPLSLN